MSQLAQAFQQIGGALQWAGLIASPLLLLPLATLLLPGVFNRIAKPLHSVIDRISGIALNAAMLFAFLMIMTQLAVVMLRFVFGLSFSWLSESVTYSFAAVFMLGVAATLRDDGHVRVDILRMRMSPRLKAIVDFSGAYILLFPICWLILDAAAPSLARSWVGFEGSRESDGLPILYLFKTLIPVFATLLMAQGLSQALKAALALRGQRTFDDASPNEIGPA